MSQKQRVRLFLDSNVLTAGIVSTWGLDKAVLSLCAARICRLVLAKAVREEVEENLLIRLSGVESKEARPRRRESRAVQHYTTAPDSR